MQLKTTYQVSVPCKGFATLLLGSNFLRCWKSVRCWWKGDRGSMYIIVHLSVLGGNPKSPEELMLAPAASDLSGFGEQLVVNALTAH